MLAHTTFDPFSTTSIVNPSNPSTDSAPSWHGFVFKSEPQNEFLTLAEPERPTFTQFRSNVLKLDTPNLPDIDLEPINSTPTSSIRDETISSERGDHIREEPDLWNTPDLLKVERTNKLISWNHFTEKEHEEPPCNSVSEAGPAVFDLLLRKSFPKSHNEHLKYVRPDVMVNALFDVGLGRSSIIFQWNERNQRFEAIANSYTVSGISQNALRYITNQHLDAGAQLRKLKRLTQSQQGSSPTKIALQTVLKSIVAIVEETIESTRHSVRTLIQLQDVYHRPFRVLSFLDELTNEVRNVSDDCHLVSAVFAVAQRMSLDSPQFENIAFAIVSKMLQPILLSIEIEVGLVVGNGNEAVQIQENLIPQLLQDSAATLYKEAKDTLHILRQYNQSLPCLSKQPDSGNILRVEFEFDAVALLQRHANDYERDSRHFLASDNRFDHVLPQVKCTPSKLPDEASSAKNPFSFDTDLFTDVQPPADGVNMISDAHDEDLRCMITAALVSEVAISVDTILTCYQAVDLSLSPFLKTQHRLLSYSALQILIQDHGLVLHTGLLGRFQLLGDGIFVSKLSASLFDSEQASGEGRRRMHTKTGLRLQSRETWPPASSELRLALMGILSESMLDVKDAASRDAISFAIRDLSDEDLEKCRDIDSIYALDFLRLDYKPSTSLIATVITPSNVDQYDQIFNQLLRLLRMKVLTQTMLRTTASGTKTSNASGVEHKFCIEAQRFVSALADYCQNSVIKSTWFAFEGKLDQINQKLSQNDFSGTLELAGGLTYLQESHGKVLDKIMRGLFLKRKQSEPKGIVDRLFEVVLRFAALISKTTSSASAPSAASKHNTTQDLSDTTIAMLSRLRKDFEMHMKTLVRWLRAESGRAGGESRDMFEQLLLRLDWNGYWSR